MEKAKESKTSTTTLMAIVHNSRMEQLLLSVHWNDARTLPGPINSYGVGLLEVSASGGSHSKLLLQLDPKFCTMEHAEYRNAFNFFLYALAPTSRKFSLRRNIRNLMNKILRKGSMVSEILTLRTQINPLQLSELLAWYQKDESMGDYGDKPSKWLKIYQYTTTESGVISITLGITTQAWKKFFVCPNTLFKILGWD